MIGLLFVVVLVMLAGKRLVGATQRLSEHRWRGAAGEIYTRNGDDLEVALDSQRITIRNGYLHRLTAPGGVLGLALAGEVATPSSDSRIYTGSSLRDIWEWQRIYGVGYYETVARETFRMGAGDDQVASVGGGDIFYGEDGNDVFIATDGNNVGEGGNGNDVLADGVMLDYTRRRVWQEGNRYYSPFLGWTQGPGYWGEETDVPDVERQERTLATTGIVMHTLTGTIDRINTNTNDSYAGGQGDDWLWGEGGDDVLAGDAGDDVVYGGEGRDDVTGGDGEDILSGDDLTLNAVGARHGDDVVDGGAGNDTLFGNGGHDDLWGGDGDGIDASLVRGTVVLGAGTDTLIDIENLGGTDAADRLVGDANDNRIEGYGGDDILCGGRGNDMLIGGIGNDTYLYSAGSGKDILVDHDAATGHADLLTLTDIDQTQLWFRHLGNDLQIDVLGTADQIVVKDWYVGGVSGADNHIERIRTADGRTLYDSDVDKLVHAMAAFAPPQAGQTRWTDGQASNGQVLLAVTH